MKLTDDFCEEHLGEYYEQLANHMAVKICQKGSPINVKQGRPKSWASGIIHALGWVNFLHDPSIEPYMGSAELAKGFGVSQGTMTSKSKIIRDVLDIVPMDTGGRLLVWKVEVNGFVMDMRVAPREFQEAAYSKGLIPYIPDEEANCEPKSNEETKVIQFATVQNKVSGASAAKKPENDSPTLF